MFNVTGRHLILASISKLTCNLDYSILFVHNFVSYLTYSLEENKSFIKTRGMPK